MTMSVNDVLSSAGLVHAGVVKWGEDLPSDKPGVYVVATSPDANSSSSGFPNLPFSDSSFDSLVDSCPAFSIDGSAATLVDFRERLETFWLADEPILYIGLAGTSLAQRVGQYYTTTIGKRAPHSGGWWLKTLSILPSLFVHYAETDDVKVAEARMISTFAGRMPEKVVAGLRDTKLVAPFANVQVPKYGNKDHGMKNYKEPGKAHANFAVATAHEEPSTTPQQPAIPVSDPRNMLGTMVRSQPITVKDRSKSYLRIPSGSKHIFPAVPGDIDLTIQGENRRVRWTPRETRSGLISLGVATMRELGTTNRAVAIEFDGLRYFIVED